MFIPRQLAVKKNLSSTPLQQSIKSSSTTHKDELPQKKRCIEDFNATRQYELPRRKRCIEESSTTRQNGPSRKRQCIEDTNPSGLHFAPLTKEDTEYFEQLICAVELVFATYAYKDKDSRKWLETHQRSINGEEGYIHLSALLTHSYLTTFRKIPSQVQFRQALISNLKGHSQLQHSRDGYLVRRIPGSMAQSLAGGEPDGELTKDNKFWNARTVYIEPHLSMLCTTPAKVLWWIKKAKGFRKAYLPIQKIWSPHVAYAFVLLRKQVAECDVRKLGWPDDWIVLSKDEHTRRTQEYITLLRTGSAESPNQGPLENPTDNGTEVLTRETDNSTLVLISGLRPNINRSTLRSFLIRTVNWFWKRTRDDYAETRWDLKLVYLDIRPDGRTAVARLATSTDARRLVEALKAKKRQANSKRKDAEGQTSKVSTGVDNVDVEAATDEALGEKRPFSNMREDCSAKKATIDVISCKGREEDVPKNRVDLATIHARMMTGDEGTEYWNLHRRTTWLRHDNA
ncbi:hypothetical protein M501DRAFT_1015842 [Patellaria atrata CBS 101060]|uniref:La-related protein 7 homolog xRRM domain-containing protein n=1 Tax=Patellaria atrata CBS 101060 TaxID=1346257 RepID=A0A9P4SDD4_9PEZI|nr:hypothetical protein M501DRAFT_1015842 [Patellaria atrata CBS 101060]